MSEEAVRLLAADPFPERALDPQGRYLLLVHRRGLLSQGYLTQPTITVHGLRIDPRTNARHAAMPYYRLTLVDLRTARSRRLAVPSSHRIGYPRWAPDGSRYFFTATVDDGVELWLGTPDEAPQRLVGPVLNAAAAAPCNWMPDSRRLLCQIVARRRAGDRPPPPGPEEPAAAGMAPPGERDRELADYFLRSQAVEVDAVSGEVRDIGEPGVFESLDPSPNGEFLLVTRRPGRPRLPAETGSDRVLEIWDASGRGVNALRDRESPPRAAHWRPSAPATLVWVERRDSTEHIMARSLPASGPARVLHRSPRRFAGLQWLEDGDRALFSEYHPGERRTRIWLIDPQAERPRLLGGRAVGGGPGGFGRPLTAMNQAGKPVVPVHDNSIYVRGRSAAGQGARSYLARLDLETLASEQVWTAEAQGREQVLELAAPDGSTVLTRRENRREPPNYRLHDLRTGAVRELTAYRHPVPALREAGRRVLRYRREDGVALSATLHVPPGTAADARLPVIMWAYPRRYEAGQAPPALAADDRFVDVEAAMRLFFLLRGYAVLDDVAMPVVGGPRDANDSFVEQIVANTRAALRAAAATGLVNPGRAGVAGHSYGAFMVGNLLAHSGLFRAGVGLSGAYNRTLTPFGFQTERRTLWEARDTYLRMSPFLYSDRIEAPLLLVHGLLDDNAGTSPMQSRYFHEAIRGTGGSAELLLLPGEGHTYRARESVMTVAAAMASWFDEHLRSPKPEVTAAAGAASTEAGTR